MKFPLLFLLSFTLCLLSCKKSHKTNYKYETILIDFDSSRAVDLRDSVTYTIKEIPLELTDNSLLTYIEQLEIKDNRIFVFDKHRLMVFDMKGAFLHSIGKKGSGPGEYTNVNSFFFEGDSIGLYDDNLQTMFYYNEDGTFIGSKKTHESMSSVYPICNKKFIGRKKYQGDRVVTPCLAILDEKLGLVANIANRNLTSGIGTIDYCYAYEDNILYWEFLNDTIFSIKDTKVTPSYFVDFQELKIPPIEKANKDIGEIINYLNSTKSKHAAGIRYVQEDTSDIRFLFAYNDNLNFVAYNKSTKKASAYYFFDSEGNLKLQYFFKYHGGNLILSAHNTKNEEDNPILLFINENK